MSQDPADLPATPQAPPSPATTTVSETSPQSTSVWENLPGPPPPAVPALDLGAAAPAIPGYEILGVLGRGGMGVVYRARQTGLDRLVALKMILAGAHAGPEERARFQSEARATARLRHPHIVQIHEVGEHDGLPFFSLEFVDGGSLGQRLGGKPLPPRPAARLVETLARAVYAAHQQGILHRDLKPANILLQRKSEAPNPKSEQETGAVADFGFRISDLEFRISDFEPKITDFGLAKRLDVEKGQTQSGAIVGTPSYMAPEQAGGHTRQVGAAADVHALGAILYELLTGRPPFNAATPLETVFQVIRQEPVPPRRFQPAVPRDLETICLKCLQKEPAKRYPSAEGLADDLRRFAEGRPIAARPVGRAERLWRWCRRNPLPAALAAVLALVLAGGLAGLTALWLEASGQRDRARTERDAAASARDEARQNFDLAKKAVDESFLVAKDQPLLQQEELRPVRRLLLEKALPFYEGLRARRQSDAGIREELATTNFRLAYIHRVIGRKADALRAYQTALDLYDRLAARHPDVGRYQRLLASTYHDLALLQNELGRPRAARASMEKARAIGERLVARHPGVGQYQAALASTHDHLGAFQRVAGERKAARRSFGRAREIAEPLVARHPNVADYQSRLGSICINLGLLQGQLGERGTAEGSFERARDIFQKLAARHPEVSKYQQNLAMAHVCLGFRQLDLGKQSAALRSLEQARDLREGLAARHPDVVGHQRALVALYGDMADLYRDLGQPATARKSLERAREIGEQLTARHPDVPGHWGTLGRCYHNLGYLEQMQGHRTAARQWFARARDLYERLAARHPEVDDYQDKLAAAYSNLGAIQNELREPAARQSLERARDLYEGLAARHRAALNFRVDLAATYCNLGIAISATGEPQESLASYAKAIRLLEAVVRREPRHPFARAFLSNAHEGRGEALARLGRHAASAAALRRAADLETGQSRAALRARCALALARAKEPARAAAEAEEVARGERLPGNVLYDLACALSLASAAARADGKLPPAERERNAEQYAARAVQLLGRARAAGLFKTAAKVDHLKKDANVDPLRDRAEFKKLLAELAAEAKQGGK
jgi:serine/threonine protein kinase/tetratricopeptide (TPR) repeat protein